MSARLTRRLVPIVAGAVIGAVTFTNPAGAAPASLGLEQCRNGSAGSPADCRDLSGSDGWVTGNLGTSNSHYVEGQSAPYRLLMEDLPTDGTVITVVLGYDTKHGGVHAIDYLTHYDRLEPHTAFGHAAEDVDPTDGVSGIDPLTTTFAIPEPSSAGSPVAGQPGLSFNSLPAGERGMTLFGGTITNVAYGAQGALNAASAETEVAVSFVPAGATGVLAWGGHLALAGDWNGNSAGGISGSPYHMRVKSWTLGSVGRQDRSLSTGGAPEPPAPAELTVTKVVVNDDGGTAAVGNFDLFVDETEVTSGVGVSLPAGAYTVSEGDHTGYVGTITGACAADGSITLAAGQVASCTITNDDVAPTLTVIKHVVNDHDGTLDAADFTMNVAGTDVSDASFPGSETGTSVTLDAGVYSVTESGPAGYTASYSAGCTGTIALGESRTCTITNDDIFQPPAPAQLTVTKVVVNDDGGTALVGDFDLFVDETEVTSGVGVSLPAGAYTVSEADHAGYVGTITGACAADGSITLAAGEVASCTITNDDVTPDPDPDPDPDPEPDPDPDPDPEPDPDPDPEPQDDPDPEPDTDPGVESSSDTTQDNQPLQSVPVSTPPLVVSPAATENSPAATTELPRTGAGLRDEALLGFALMALGLLSRTLGRRRTNPSVI